VGVLLTDRVPLSFSHESEAQGRLLTALLLDLKHGMLVMFSVRIVVARCRPRMRGNAQMTMILETRWELEGPPFPFLPNAPLTLDLSFTIHCIHYLVT